MLNFVKQILKVYSETLLFKRSFSDTPESCLMLVVAMLLAVSISVFQLALNAGIGKLPLPMYMALFLSFFQIILFLLYTRVVLWTQNKLAVWYKLCTCWLMMLFLLDLVGLATSAILVLASFLPLKQVFIWLGLLIGTFLSLWQVYYSLRLFKELLQKPMFLAVMIYVAWLGLNLLFIMLFKQWLHF